jgi:hypothetical protein
MEAKSACYCAERVFSPILHDQGFKVLVVGYVNAATTNVLVLIGKNLDVLVELSVD